MPTKESLKKKNRPSGWAAVARRAEEIEERREEVENRIREFWLKEDETARIQFLQDEPYCFNAHNVKRDGHWKVVPCQLDTQKTCVLCSEGSKQTWRAAFKILDYRGNWDSERKCFKNDEPIEKLWVIGATLTNQLKALIDKKKKNLTDMVLEVSRSGHNKDTTYNFEVAYNEKTEKRIRPIEWDEKFDSAEELCQPPTDDEIERNGYVVANN